MENRRLRLILKFGPGDLLRVMLAVGSWMNGADWVGEIGPGEQVRAYAGRWILY